MFNFLNRVTLFTPNAQMNPESEQDTAHVLAVWGSPSSGKTTVSIRLAKRLAENRKDVVLLLCDATTPMLPCICAPSDLDCEHSLGSILAAIHVTGTLVRQNCMLHKKYKHLAIIAMLKGENEYTYPSYTENQVKELITVLREVAPYVIIDCGSVISSDMLSTISLIESDAVLRLANCNLRSVSYFSSQLPLLKKMKNWDTEKQIKAASNVRICEASENMEQALDGMPFQIPHSDEVEQLVLAGDLFKDLTLRESRSFRKEIEKISKEVFGI